MARTRTFDLGTFPYDSIQAATKDSFKKIGGPNDAFYLMVSCWKQDIWRKKSQMKMQGERERAKAITVEMEQRAARMDMTIEEYMIHLDTKA
jgi:hypothetical protein